MADQVSARGQPWLSANRRLTAGVDANLLPQDFAVVGIGQTSTSSTGGGPRSLKYSESIERRSQDGSCQKAVLDACERQQSPDRSYEPARVWKCWCRLEHLLARAPALGGASRGELCDALQAEMTASHAFLLDERLRQFEDLEARIARCGAVLTGRSLFRGVAAARQTPVRPRSRRCDVRGPCWRTHREPCHEGLHSSSA